MATGHRGQNYYPVDLNPFGEDDGEEQEYPDYLSPFGDDDKGPEAETSATNKVDDYDDSLNPFGEEEEEGQNATAAITTSQEDFHDKSNPFNEDDNEDGIEDQNKVKEEDIAQINVQVVVNGDFESDEKKDDREEDKDKFEEESKYSDTEQDKRSQSQKHPVASDNEASPSTTPTPSLLDNQHKIQASNSVTTKQNLSHHTESLELPPPPVPLPRTKSLLKKEQRNQRILQQQSTESSFANNRQLSSSNLSTSSMNDTSLSRPERKKRIAPPVPVNYKRQVSGSLEDIEVELNDIGDKLAAIDKESTICEESLKETYQRDEIQFARSKAKYIELIKRRNSISRRQKELMYRKRELKLDQIHSDIEYELRMIGNKQLSARTKDDESREKELLTKLVEIVEEKNDIVENLNKESSNDGQDIEEAFRRLNLVNVTQPIDKTKDNAPKSNKKIQNLNKSENCDKNSLHLGNKLSKIATLLPKGGTIKGTMKLKRKHLFKKSDSYKTATISSPTASPTSTPMPIDHSTSAPQRDRMSKI